MDGHVRPRRGGERGDKRRELKREGDCFILVQARAAHTHGSEDYATDVWEEKLLGAIYKLCVPDGKQDPALRSEVFLKVERTHLLGLRTRRLEIRKKFFALYHGDAGKTLFQRLQYILTIQDWDAMADTFWLMQGLDLILSTLAEDERIMLAPNSALVSSLLPFDADTKQPCPFGQAKEHQGEHHRTR